MYKLMTAGPTEVRENVLKARSMPFTNPDIDSDFFDYYKETCELFGKALNTDNEAFILGGEGILGLEAACASLTEPGDRVLVIDNGIFGKGYADFVKIYGGEPFLLTYDYHKEIDVSLLEDFLSKDSNFKYATVVHCDTPSGVLNDVISISNILHKYNILSVVDSVAAAFGNPLDLSKGHIDILCGGSQKALSAPPGLTIIWVSKEAFKTMENRRIPIASFYANILAMKNYYKDKWFPYTMPVSDIMGLRTALDNFLEDADVYKRHSEVAKYTRNAVENMGLSLYLESGFSDTVTVINVPEGYTDTYILDKLKNDYNILISGCFDILAGKVIRIGHMGENAHMEKVKEVIDALGNIIKR